MNISELSIRRPVLSTVLTLIILLFGLIGYSYLGVREYPSVDNHGQRGKQYIGIKAGGI